MLRIFLVIIVSSLVLRANSQFESNSIKLKKSNISYGVEAGINISSLQPEDLELYRSVIDTKLKPGFKIGMPVVWKFSKYFAFETGFFFVTTARKNHIKHQVNSSESSTGVYGTTIPAIEQSLILEGHTIYKIRYFEFPLKMNYSLNNLVFSGGVYFFRTRKGSSESTYTTRSLETGELLSEYSETNEFSRKSLNTTGHQYILHTASTTRVFSNKDFGLLFGLGYRYKQILFKTTLNYGLKDMITSYQYFPLFFARNNPEVQDRNRILTFSFVFFLR